MQIPVAGEDSGRLLRRTTTVASQFFSRNQEFLHQNAPYAMENTNPMTKIQEPNHTVRFEEIKFALKNEN